MTNFSRRGLLKTGAAAGVLAATGASADGHGPKRGGDVKMGIAGANTSDSWDGRTHSD
ncbi:MAG: twin-arginine translocation signal domain-containing protein, partial [Pseudomonadota bacterium]